MSVRSCPCLYRYIRGRGLRQEGDYELVLKGATCTGMIRFKAVFNGKIVQQQFVMACVLKRSRKPRLTAVGDPPRWPRDTPLSTKVDIKFRRQVAVAQSV
jgi:hypothetical protein